MAKPIENTWRPDDSAFDLLAQHMIPREFAEDAIPEFILYWRERGGFKHSWTMTFVKHVIHRYRHHQANPAARIQPVLMTRDWKPDQLALEQLASEGIPAGVIRDALVNFLLYWIESGQARNDWSVKFLEFVRNYAIRVQGQRQRLTRDLSLQEQLSDRSWAGENND